MPGNVELPLLLPESLAQHLRRGDWARSDEQTDSLASLGDSLAGMAEAIADSATEKAALAEQSARHQVERAARLQSRLGDSLRAEGLRRGDSIQRAMSRMADSLKAR